MPFLYEHGDMLNRPIECFYFDTSSKYFPVHAHWHFYMELIYMYDGKVKLPVRVRNTLLKRAT